MSEQDQYVANMKAITETEVNKYISNIPNMGNHMVLDFHNVTVDLDNLEELDLKITSILQSTKQTIEGKQTKKVEPKGASICYLLSDSNFSIRTWPEHASCGISFWYHGENDTEVLANAEEMFCDWLGWENCTQNVTLARGQRTGILTNDFPEKAEIYKNVKFVHREKTPFQELRVYDTILEGRIMTLDGAVQFSSNTSSNPEKDNYTVDMAQVVKKDKDYEHIVIIGGGDLIIARYLMEFCPKVKKVTVCEIDQRVIECTKKYFDLQGDIEKYVAQGRLEIEINGGAEYMETLLKKGKENCIGGFIVDCTDFVDDTVNEKSIAAELFTSKFYNAIYKCLQPGSSMSQQISHLCFTQGFISRNTTGGFQKENIEIFRSETPEYGGPGFLPLGISKKAE